MPTARRSRLIAAPAGELWDVICDPHHLPRWWPRVSRVEDVDGGAFTEVLKTDKGKLVRADFALVAAPGGTALQGEAGMQDEAGSAGARRIAWAQQLEGSPFARLLASAETEVWLTPRGERTTEVTIELRQTMAGFHSGPTGFTWGGFFPRFGTHLVRRAATATLDEALDGLERISTDSGAAGNA